MKCRHICVELFCGLNSNLGCPHIFTPSVVLAGVPRCCQRCRSLCNRRISCRSTCARHGKRNHILVPHMRQVVCPGFATSPVLNTYLRGTRSAVCWDQWGNRGIGEKPSAASAAARDAEVFSIEAMVQSQTLLKTKSFSRGCSSRRGCGSF